MFPAASEGYAWLLVVIHADQPEENVEGLDLAMCEWAGEMVRVETGVRGRGRVP